MQRARNHTVTVEFRRKPKGAPTFPRLHYISVRRRAAPPADEQELFWIVVEEIFFESGETADFHRQPRLF
jgi:hypothetical protein